MLIEKVKEVSKAWGKELWLVNNERYCGKLLHINKGASSSIHAHKVKQETFYVLSGETLIIVNNTTLHINEGDSPLTINPMDKHSFKGITNAVILEISTHHEDSDVIRYSDSKSK